MALQLFKRRNVATVKEDCTLEDDGMSDSGYLESQANNMEQITVRVKQDTVSNLFVVKPKKPLCTVSALLCSTVLCNSLVISIEQWLNQ